MPGIFRNLKCNIILYIYIYLKSFMFRVLFLNFFNSLSVPIFKSVEKCQVF